MKREGPSEYVLGTIFAAIGLLALASAIGQFVTGLWFLGVLNLVVTGTMSVIAYAFFRSGRVDR